MFLLPLNNLVTTLNLLRWLAWFWKEEENSSYKYKKPNYKITSFPSL